MPDSAKESKTQFFLLTDLETAQRAATACLAAVGMLPDVYEVTIRKRKGTITEKQRRLLWMWHGEYVEHFGVDGGKLAQHDVYKLDFVLPILLRDDDDPGLHALWKLAETNFEAKRKLVELISSNDLDVPQTTEALTEYDMRSAMQGCQFTHPDDLYWAALQREEETHV